MILAKVITWFQVKPWQAELQTQASLSFSEALEYVVCNMFHMKELEVMGG